jgi:hypothetical protein
MRLLLGLCLSVLLWSVAAFVSEASALAEPMSLPSAHPLLAHPVVTQIAVAQIASPQLAAVPPTEILSRLFTEPELQRAWFADSFLAQISLAQVSQIIQGIKGSIGNYQSIEDVDKGFVLTFERGTVPTHLEVNPQGQITGLLFETPQLAALPLDQLLAEFAALPGQVHLLATRNGEIVAAANADQPLAVGSTFKLSILQVLKSQIEAGTHRWDEVVALQDNLKSLPSGFLQTWPAGSPITLETLATLMISQSDNTATDHLLSLVGRENVEAISDRNRPFLSTREAFVLKDPTNQSILSRWRRSSEKSTFLSALAALPLPDASLFNGGSQALDVEWFYTAHELCSAMEAIADLPLMSVNPGLVNSADWDKVAFKGGSEPGVENFTTFLINDDESSVQTQLCVTATWNHESGIDEIKFSTLYRSLIESVR